MELNDEKDLAGVSHVFRLFRFTCFANDKVFSSLSIFVPMRLLRAIVSIPQVCYLVYSYA